MSNIFTPPSLGDGARWQGMRIGLLGGSFNPPHSGHLHIAQLALKKLQLDFIWWIVTPQNPLKETKGMAPYEERFRAVQDITAHHPQFMATHLEDQLGSRYTYETVKGLKGAFPKTDFVWICGMDNALIFHKWDRWQSIIEEMPIVFIARPPASGLIRHCPLRMLGPSYLHSYIRESRKIDLKQPGIYWMLGTRMMDISSTQIRGNGKA